MVTDRTRADKRPADYSGRGAHFPSGVVREAEATAENQWGQIHLKPIEDGFRLVPG